MITAWLLPTGENRLTLWCPADLRVGELAPKKVTVLSPFPIEDEETLQEMGALLADNVWGIQARRGFRKRYADSFWFRMLWGVIWLLGRDWPVETWTNGLYLLLIAPVMVNVVERLWARHQQATMEKAKDALYDPEIEVVVSERLRGLMDYWETGSRIMPLADLADLGLIELVGFYRRTAWSSRWNNRPPTGCGVFNYEDARIC